MVPEERRGGAQRVLRPLHLDGPLDQGDSRPPVHRRRIRAQRRLHAELLQVPARAQLRLEGADGGMAAGHRRPRPARDARGDQGSDALLALARLRRLPRRHGGVPGQGRRRQADGNLRCLERPFLGEKGIPRGRIRRGVGASGARDHRRRIRHGLLPGSRGQRLQHADARLRDGRRRPQLLPEGRRRRYHKVP